MNQRELDEMIDEGADGIDVGADHPNGWELPYDPVDAQARLLRGQTGVHCKCAPRRHPSYKSMARCAYPTARVCGDGKYAWVERHDEGQDRVYLADSKRALYLTISRRAMFARDLPDEGWYVELSHLHVR